MGTDLQARPDLTRGSSFYYLKKYCTTNTEQNLTVLECYRLEWTQEIQTVFDVA